MDKKKGFTLIELLATIVIVALVFIISGVLIYNKKDVDERLTSAQESLIINSASDFVNEFRNRKDNWLENISDDGASFCVSLTSLIDLGFFKSNSDDYIMKNKDKLLVSVKVDANQVYSYDIISNSDANINASCLYKDIDSFLSNTKDSIDIKNENSTSIGTLGYDITKISNTKYDVKTDLSVKLGSDMIEIDAPVYVAIVLDNSGSMIGDAWDRAKEASIELSKTIVDNITSSKVALIQYGDSPMLVRDFEHKVLSSNSFVEAGGGTNVSGSLDLVASLYKELDIPSYAKLYTILLYDGEVDYYSYLKKGSKIISNGDTSVYYNNFLSAFKGTNSDYFHNYSPAGNYGLNYSITSSNYLKDTINSTLITIGYNFNESNSSIEKMKKLSSLDNTFCSNSDYEEEITETSDVDILSDVELSTTQIIYPFVYDEETKSISSTNKEPMTESYEIYELDLTDYNSEKEVEIAIDYKSTIASYSDYFRIIISEKSEKLTSIHYTGCSEGWKNNSFCNWSYSKETTTKTNIYGGKKYYIHFIYEKRTFDTDKDYGVTIKNISYSSVENKTIYDSKEDGFNKENLVTLSTPEESKIVYETKIENDSLVLSSYNNPSITGGYKKIDLTGKDGIYLLTVNASIDNRIGVISVTENETPPITAAQYKIFGNLVGYENDNASYACNNDSYRCFWGKITNNDFSFKLEGNKVYYIHFVYYLKFSESNSNFTINKLSLMKLKDEIINVDLDRISDESCNDSSEIVSCLRKSTTYNFSFVPNTESFISTNKEVSNSCSHNYSEIDLTNDSEDKKFVLNFKSTVNSDSYDYGNIIITTSPDTPSLTKMACDLNKDYVCVNISSYINSRENVVSLTGGKKYYVHFMYCKNFGASTYYSDYYSVNKFTLYKGSDYKELNFTDVVNYKDYSFEEKDKQLVSTNQGKGNSISHSYMKIDLSGYSSDYRFIISVNDIVNNGDYGMITLDSSSKMPIITFGGCDTNYSSYTLVCMASSRSGQSNSPTSHSITVNGGPAYYLHFVYYKVSSTGKYDDIYTIDSVKIKQIVPDDTKKVDLSKGMYIVKGYNFREEMNNDSKIYVSDNLDAYTSAHSYIKIDLNKDSSDKRFNIEADLSCKGNSGSCDVVINHYINNPNIYNRYYKLKNTYDRNEEAIFDGELVGNQVYYMHFVNRVYSDTSGSFTINSIKLSEVSVVGKNSYCYYDSNTEQISNVFSNLSSKVVTNTQKFEADKVKITLTAVKNDDATFHIEDNDGKTFDYVEQEFKISELTQEEENKILELAMDNYHFVLDTIEKQCNNDDGCEIETKIFKLKLDIYSNNSNVISKTVELAEENLPTVKIKYKEGKAIN